MGLLKKWSSFWGLIFVTLWGMLIFGAEVTDRYTPISSFKDDKSVTDINDNFRRITEIILGDTGFNLVVKGTSTVVKLNNSQSDTGYGIFFHTSWTSTFTAVMSKTVNDFKIEHSSPGVAAGGTIDWILVR